MEKSSASPERTRPTRFLTGAWRCDVPNNAAAVVVSACNCSGRTFDGPDPNRPSRGLMSAGIWRGSAIIFRVVSGPDAVAGRADYRRLGTMANIWLSCADVGGCDPHRIRALVAVWTTALGRSLANSRYLRYCLDIRRPNVNLVGGARNGQDSNGPALAP